MGGRHDDDERESERRSREEPEDEEDLDSEAEQLRPRGGEGTGANLRGRFRNFGERDSERGYAEPNGRPTFGGMTREEIDARMEAVEARTDTKFAELIGEFNAKFAETRAEFNTKFAETRAEFNTKFAEMRAESDKQFAELRGELGEIRASLVPLAGLRSTIVVTGISSVIALAALLLGLLAYGGDRFGAGLEMSAVADAAARRAVEQALPRQPLGAVDARPSAAE